MPIVVLYKVRDKWKDKRQDSLIVIVDGVHLLFGRCMSTQYWYAGRNLFLLEPPQQV